MCNRGYISISSAKYDEFMKITKFVSPKHFSRNFPFSKQDKLDPTPTHHSLKTIIELIESKFESRKQSIRFGST